MAVKDRTMGWNATDFDPNAAYDALIATASKEWGMTVSEVEEFIAQIEWHESKGDHTIKQILDDGSAGRGRGLFQYEMDRGGERGGGSTARRRFGYWMEDQGVDVGVIPEDFSRLGPQLQRAIFLADALAKGGNPKSMGVHNWWIDKHWSGPEKDKFDRSQAFISSMKSKYDNNY